MSHKTRELTITFDVDEEVYEMVEWLNSLHWTYTMDSCRGYGDEPKWVTFVCMVSTEGDKIIERAEKEGMKISSREIEGCIQYCISWR